MGIEVVVLRFASTYGPGKTARHGAMGVTSRIVEVRRACRRRRKDDFIYNKDSANGIYLATMAGKLKSCIFNIGTGVGATLRDFEAVIRRHIPNAVMEIGPGLNFSVSLSGNRGLRHFARPRRARYRPEYDLERGIADYLQSLNRPRRLTQPKQGT